MSVLTRGICGHCLPLPDMCRLTGHPLDRNGVRLGRRFRARVRPSTLIPHPHVGRLLWCRCGRLCCCSRHVHKRLRENSHQLTTHLPRRPRGHRDCSAAPGGIVTWHALSIYLPISTWNSNCTTCAASRVVKVWPLKSSASYDTSERLPG